MNERLAIGAIVWLKSGSPKMTVKHYRETAHDYGCSWFVGNEIKEHHFTGDQLTTDDPDTFKPVILPR